MAYRRSAKPRPRVLARAVEGAYPHLGRIAASLGAEHRGGARLDAFFADRHVVFDLELNSGTVTGLAIHVASGPYPAVTLRPEQAADREGKARGINREVELGDPAFDPFVYIESDASDDAVQRLLRAATTRAAALACLGPKRRIDFASDGVRLKISPSDCSPGGAAFDPVVVRPEIEALVTLADIEPFEDTGPLRPRRGGRLFAVAAVSGLPGGALAFVGLDYFRPLEWWLPAGGAAVALVGWLAARPFVARAMSGDSRAFLRYRITMWILLADALGWGLGLPTVANGLVDFGEGRPKSGKVVSVHGGDEGDPDIEIAWEDGTRSTRSYAGVREGSSVTAYVHHGALGVPWTEWRLRVRPP